MKFRPFFSKPPAGYRASQRAQERGFIEAMSDVALRLQLRRFKPRSNQKLRPADRQRLLVLRVSYGWGIGALADEFGVSKSLVRQVIHKELAK